MNLPAEPLPARTSLIRPVSSPMPSCACVVTSANDAAVLPVGTYPPSGIGVPLEEAVMSTALKPRSET